MVIGARRAPHSASVTLTRSKIVAGPSTDFGEILVRALKRYQENSETRTNAEVRLIAGSNEAWYFPNALLTYNHTNER